MLSKSSALLAVAVFAGAGFIAGGKSSPAAPANRQHHSADAVDINSAGLDQLMKVPGITRIWAERIVRFRPYRSKQDLLDHGILPGAVYFRIRDSIVAHRLQH